MSVVAVVLVVALVMKAVETTAPGRNWVSPDGGHAPWF